MVTIRVEDKIPPKIVYPARDKKVECDGQGNLAEFQAWLESHAEAWAFDNCCDVTWSYRVDEHMSACGATGYYKVTFIASDCAGNSSSTSATFTIKDTTPPTLTPPGDVDLGCNPTDTSPDTTGWAVASNDCDPSPTVTYTDSVSALGCTRTITRVWRASDACGNSAQCTQLITYTQDTTPPTIHCPGHIWRSSSEPPGSLVWVDFNIGATDDCSSPTVTCVPSGGWFRVGETSLASTSCTAQDACGNETSQGCTFLVTVEFVCPPLVARPDFAEAPGYVWIPVLDNDSGYGLRIVGVSPPTCGSAWPSGDGIVYTTMGWSPGCLPPTVGMQETFSYIVEDACGNQASAAVTVTITCDICPLSVPGGKEEK